MFLPDFDMMSKMFPRLSPASGLQVFLIACLSATTAFSQSSARDREIAARYRWITSHLNGCHGLYSMPGQFSLNFWTAQPILDV